MQHLANLELGLKNGPLTREKYLEAKHYGFLCLLYTSDAADE